MKRFIFTLITLLILNARLPGQWEILNEGVKKSLNTIDFVNENIGWLAGSEGLLLVTKDGGQTWNPVPIDENWSIKKIDFINDSVGWAIGYTDTAAIEMIIKTTDGGENWLLQKKRYNFPIDFLFAVNDSVVYATGESIIYKTEDGGSNWANIAPKIAAYYSSIYFLDEETGIVTCSDRDAQCNSIWKTKDGGNSWHELNLPFVGSFQDLQFIDDTTGYFISCNGTNEFFLYETKDFGDSWEVKSRHANPIVSLSFIDSQTACAVMIDESTRHHNILKSTDGGRTWEKKFSINWTADKIYFCCPKVGFLVGGGTIVRSVDAGDHWQTQFWTCPLNDVCFIDRNRGFVCGGRTAFHVNEGYFFVTHDGGKSWDVASNTGMEVLKCLFVNDLVGFALMNGGYSWSYFSMLKTEDGGKSWMDKNPGFSIFDFCFINENICWAVGRYQEQDSSGTGFLSGSGAGIFKTIDQGENWDPVWKYPDQNEVYNTLHAILFIDSTAGWAVGDNGLIVKYTAGNKWVEQIKMTDLPLNKIYFIDKDNGFIAGGYLNDEGLQTILCKTTSDGNTWEKIPDLPYLIHDLYFHDTQHGWAVGADKSGKGVILETRDGGEHWAIEKDSLLGPLNALSYRDKYLWAVGDYGLVLRTTVDSGTRIDEQPGSAVPPTCRLSQNYPNPFNATTAISYQLSAISEVELSIFNLSGQKVATLISEQQPAGIYTVEWDAADFANGVYLYRLIAGDFSATRKLILIK